MAIAQPPSSEMLRHLGHISNEFPLGIEAIYSRLIELYPSQTNPLQITARKKFWMGGNDRLDYVNIYSNPGDSNLCIPPHWHYVSMGLTDLHGDGRVHRRKGREQSSGFGYELTFRLLKDCNENTPPIWPAGMMQHLARHAFMSEKLQPGDFIPWNAPLDGMTESRIRDVLFVNDAQLSDTVYSPYGQFSFLQVVGVCPDELKATQEWTVDGVCDLLRRYPATGGRLLVTDIRRDNSVFEIDRETVEDFKNGVANDGSNMIGVQACILWTEWNDAELEYGSEPVPTVVNPLDVQHSSITAPVSGAGNPQPLNGVDLRLNYESALFLPLALRGRLAHGRHFTFKSLNGLSDVTLLPPGVRGTFTVVDDPYVYRDTWLQLMIYPDLQAEMLRDLTALEEFQRPLTQPMVFSWPKFRLRIWVG